MNTPEWLRSARTQTSLLLLGSLLTVLTTSMFFIAFTLNQRFAELEARETQSHIERVAEIISNELGFLGKRIGDWGDWDDAADYFQTRSRKFEEANLEVSVLESMNLSSIRFYQIDDRFQGGIERQPTYSYTSLKAILDQHLPEHPEIWPEEGSTSYKSGILKLGETYFIFATKNVRPTDRQGPALGKLIFLRLLDQEFPQLISTLSKLNIQMSVVNYRDEPQDPEAIRVQLPNLLAIERATYNLQAKDFAHSRIWAYDSNKQAVLRFDFSLPRELLAQGHQTLRILFIAFGISILITLLVQTWGLQKILLNKVTKLRNEVSLITIQDPLQKQVSVVAQTEVRDLAIKINEMLIEIRQRQLFTEHQHQQIHQLQMNQVLLQERETSEKSLRMASELRFHLAGMVAHRLNNPINFIQLSLLNSRDITLTLEKLFKNLFSGASEQDPEVLACKREFEQQFSNLNELYLTMEKGLQKSAESIREIRLLSGVDGAKLESLSSAVLLQTMSDLIEELSLDNWKHRLQNDSSEVKFWTLTIDRNILKNALEILLTVCLQNSEGIVRCSLQGDSEKNWYIHIATDFQWEAHASSALERSLRHILETCHCDIEIACDSSQVKAKFISHAS